MAVMLLYELLYAAFGWIMWQLLKETWGYTWVQNTFVIIFGVTFYVFLIGAMIIFWKVYFFQVAWYNASIG